MNADIGRYADALIGSTHRCIIVVSECVVVRVKVQGAAHRQVTGVLLAHHRTTGVSECVVVRVKVQGATHRQVTGVLLAHHRTRLSQYHLRRRRVPPTTTVPHRLPL